MNYPRISVVTPCYNHQDYIGETIESVISQGYPNLQYIVVNDGSTDGSGRIIRSYERDITLILELDGHRPSPVWAINKGFEHADGDILGWISSDDILLPKCLFTIAKVFTDLPHVEWVTGLMSTINSRGELVSCSASPKFQYDYLIGNWEVIQQESTYFRKILWERAGNGLDEKWLQAFDTELWTRFFAETTHYELEAPIGAFRTGPQSRSFRNFEEFLAYNERALAKMKSGVPREEKFWAWIYTLLKSRPMYGLLRLAPEAMLVKTALRRFSDSFVTYDYESDRWIATNRSAFRRN